jgi:ferredoxin-type protein NapH
MRTNRQKIRKGLILISFFLFPAFFYYLSPALILDASAKGIINGSFIMFGLLFASALLLGRGYCGWLCPGAGCQEAIFLARDRKVGEGDLIKWLIWIPWLGGICVVAWRAGGYSRVDFFYQTTYGLSIGSVQALVVYYLVLFLLIVLPAFLVGRRSFCHHLCWMAPFMILGRAARNIFGWWSLGLAVEPERCNGCHLCTKQCPMSLPVEELVKRGNMENHECILCGTCVDACPKHVLAFRWGKGRRQGLSELQ